MHQPMAAPQQPAVPSCLTAAARITWRVLLPQAPELIKIAKIILILLILLPEMQFKLCLIVSVQSRAGTLYTYMTAQQQELLLLTVVMVLPLADFLPVDGGALPFPVVQQVLLLPADR